MKLTEREKDLRGVEPDPLLRDAPFRLAFKHPEELTTSAIIHNEEEVVGGLEAIVQGHDEGVVDCREDLALREAALELRKGTSLSACF